MATYRDEAVVLRTYKLGESDRIIVLYCRKRGKVSAVAKGIRRTKSKFGSRLEPASVVDIQLYEGKNLDIVTQVERRLLLGKLRSSVEMFTRASILLECVDRFSVEADSNPALYLLLVRALQELDRSGNPLVVPAFVVKLLALEGVEPRVDACVQCNDTAALEFFQLHGGGVFCRSCRRGHPISSGALDALRAILAGNVRQVLDATSLPVAFELEELSTIFVEEYTERRLKSSSVLREQAHAFEDL